MGGEEFNIGEDEAVVPELAVFLASESTAASLKALADDYELSDDGRSVFFKAVIDIIRGRIELDDLAVVLMDDAGMEPEEALELQTDVIEDLLFDFEDKLELQRGIYVDLHPEEFLPPRPAEVEPADIMADEIIGRSGLQFDDEAQKKRLKGIAAAFLKEVRDEAETVVMFEKPAKTGGMAYATR